MSIQVVLDHAGHLTFVPDAPSLSEALEEAEKNPRIAIINVAYIPHNGPYQDANDFAQYVPYEVTEIKYAELSSWERQGCQYHECHNLSYGPDYQDENYCDQHAGPVTDEYYDVEEIWEGSVVDFENFTEPADVEKFIQKVQESVIKARAEATLNEEFGVQVTVLHHVHEFDERSLADKFDGDCSCGQYSESFQVEYDSRKDEPGENGLPKVLT